MYYNPYDQSTSPHLLPAYNYMISQPIPRTYPPVETKILKSSIQTFPLLMEQGKILLNRFRDEPFALRIMRAAQEGRHAEVNHLLHSIGLKVPVHTRYSPTGVKFELIAPPTPSTMESCCSLTFGIKWGR